VDADLPPPRDPLVPVPHAWRPPRPRAGLDDEVRWARVGVPRRQHTVEVVATQRAPAELRRHVRTVLHHWQCQHLADSADLAVSELSTELLHRGAPALVVRLDTAGSGTVRLQVRSTVPAPVPSSPASGAHRARRSRRAQADVPCCGLGLVRRFTRRAGRFTTPDGVLNLWCDL
jgi:hypothetical protein